MRSNLGPALRLAAVIVLLSFLSFQAKADIQAIRGSDNALWAAFGTSFLNYKETIAPPDIPDSEHGWMPSIALGGSFLGNNGLYMALEGDYSFGNADYNGALLDNNGIYDIPYKGTTQESIANFDGKVGEGFALGGNFMFIPYADLGFHTWDRKGQSSALAYGFDEKYENFQALAGLLLQFAPTNRLVLSAYGSGGTTFAAQMKTYGTTFDLGSSGVYKLGGKVGFDLTKHTEMFTALDYHYFSYGQSPMNRIGYEPTSHTSDTAVRVGVSYHFR
jgi:hypothetical protein